MKSKSKMSSFETAEALAADLQKNEDQNITQNLTTKQIDEPHVGHAKTKSLGLCRFALRLSSQSRYRSI